MKRLTILLVLFAVPVYAQRPTSFDGCKAKGSQLRAPVPQVYLHYDLTTLDELRGLRRIPRQRMDFLLLLERGARIVLEVDGSQHYSDTSGRAAPEKYAEMARADRGLRLRGTRFTASAHVSCQALILIRQ